MTSVLGLRALGRRNEDLKGFDQQWQSLAHRCLKSVELASLHLPNKVVSNATAILVFMGLALPQYQKLL